ncbi:MAG: hypothetical protein ACQ5SW_02275 [Sphaerochaetaceae bacterium]
MTRYTPQDLLFYSMDQTVMTTPFLIDMLDSALIEHIQQGNIETAYGVLEMSINVSQTLENNTLSEAEGKDLLQRVKRAMSRGNIAQAKQHMVEFALR